MKRRRILWIGAVVGAAIVAIVLVVFQPQKLFIDKRVDEPLPAAAVAAIPEPSPALEAGAPVAPAAGPQAALPAATATASTAPSGSIAPRAAAVATRGAFRSLAHPGSGSASLLKAGAAYVVRFEDLDVENGPDLHVYLSPAASDSNSSAFKKDFLDLGKLKGNKGNQNYELPAGADPTRYKSVVVWCQRFSVGFAVAPLS
ncbi:MAG: DM13 domain-containing protein [Actinomycetota bacterium]